MNTNAPWKTKTGAMPMRERERRVRNRECGWEYSFELGSLFGPWPTLCLVRCQLNMLHVLYNSKFYSKNVGSPKGLFVTTVPFCIHWQSAGRKLTFTAFGASISRRVVRTFLLFCYPCSVHCAYFFLFCYPRSCTFPCPFIYLCACQGQTNRSV